jgi:bud emergence protein 1
MFIVKAKKRSQIYGVVMYDFKAERPDELDAQAGEAIVVISQTNHEWFIAKPIGRLGGPGLIPVSFVQVRDAQTDEVVVQDKLLFHLNKEEDEIYESRPLMMVNSVSVDSYILEGDQYWFVVYASVGNGLHRILYRLYEGSDYFFFFLLLLTC